MKNSGRNSFPWREWTAAILWLILIAIESTPWLSAQNTGHVMYQLLASLFGSLNASDIGWANAALRKVGHVTGYGVLSWLFFRAWRATLGSRAVSWAPSWSAIAFFMTAAVASLDEWHQTFFPSRTGSFHDVLLDSTAALAAQMLLFAFLRKRRSAPVKDESPVSVG